MRRTRPRRAALTLQLLEDRRLLSGLSGTWLGQDGRDLAGPSSVLGPSDVQDIHIALSGLPTNRTVTFADISGLGGSDWQYRGPWGPWAVALVRAAGSAQADLFFEPTQVETGRPFNITLKYDDGSTSSIWVNGGAANPNLRMPQAALQVAWVGQDGTDHVGLGPSVGPDGLQDARIVLSHLSAGIGIDSVTVTGSSGRSWAFGVNRGALSNAELTRHTDDPTRADLVFQPDRDLAGQTLTVDLVYSNGKTDSATVVAGHTNPNLAVAAPPPAPTVAAGISARWLGQDGLNLIGPGDVHLSLSGLPKGRTVVGASLSDQADTLWVYQPGGPTSYYADAFASPLALRRASDPTQADLTFSPSRDETGSTLTLRVLLNDGSTLFTQLPGGAADPTLTAQCPDPTAVVAHPGDDLNALARRFGGIRLSAGVYRLSAPLVLSRPIIITGDAGATLLFSQGPNDAPWSAAIKIQAGRTTLDRLTVRFATPIRWAPNINYGPAVIGTTDNYDNVPNVPKPGITLTRLDLQGPPASTTWEEAPRLIRLATAQNGRIEGNLLRGGVTEFLGGPWRIANNVYLGTLPNSYAYAVFAGHQTHDLVLQGNSTSILAGSGKTWRFLVLTGTGFNDQVLNNVVTGIGPRDNDTVPSDNAPEIILTESFSLRFEGKPSSISADGRILQIPYFQGDVPRTGDAVAILSGPFAGQWRRIAQAIGPTTFLLDTPLPQGNYAISIEGGFVNEVFRNNTVDARGSSTAADLYLAGNHFGTQVIGNHFLGGDSGFRVIAAPSESPVQWGWSHAPALGITITDNTIEDAVTGGLFAVEHGPPIKSDQGRVYASGEVSDTTVRWSPAFLTAHPNAPGLTIGEPGSLDTGELLVTMQGNALQSSSSLTSNHGLVVNSATVNGQPLLDQRLTLPAVQGQSHPSGVWLGQDGYDVVGPSPIAGSDGIQDIHIALSGLDPTKAIAFVDISGLGGGDWQYNGPWGPWKAALVRVPGASTAHLFLQPYQRETGRPFNITVRYTDGSSVNFWVTGGPADPTLRLPGGSLRR